MSTATATATSTKAASHVAAATAHPASVKLAATLAASAIVKHMEAGRTDLDTVMEFLETSAYPLPELVQLHKVLGATEDERNANLARVMEAQQGMAVVKVAREPKSRKAGCTITRAEFREHAKPMDVTVGDVPLTATVKEFSTGSLGWNLTGKTNIRIGDKTVTVQIGLNMTVIGSKELA